MNKQKLILLLSLCCFLFWNTSQLINVYQFSIVGALFEFLWLPMLMLLFSVPIISFVFWVKEKFNFRTFYFYALLVSSTTLLQMLLSK